MFDGPCPLSYETTVISLQESGKTIPKEPFSPASPHFRGAGAASAGVSYAREVLDESVRLAKLDPKRGGMIDFDDQLYMSLRVGTATKRGELGPREVPLWRTGAA